MSFDPFIFTPSPLDDLNLAVERAQKDACLQALRFFRGDECPSSAEFASAVQNVRHLTAIQRALRGMGGALFDPDSKLSPAERHDLFMRRVERVEAAYARATGAPHVPARSQASTSSTPLARRSLGEGGSTSSTPSTSSTSSDSSHLSNLSPALASLDPDYCPPDIEKLLSAVDLLTKCSGDRWGRILEHPYRATAEDRRFETLAVRNLTAIHRTLRRMSALALAEDEPAENLEKELLADLDDEPLPLLPRSPRPFNMSNPSDRAALSNLFAPSEPSPSHSSSTPSNPSNPSDLSDLSDLSDSSTPHTPGSPSFHSASSSSRAPAADEELPVSETNPVPEQPAVRPVPPVPEIRPVSASRRAPSSTRYPSSTRSGSRSASLHMSDAEEKEYLLQETERLKGFYPPGHVSADDPAYGLGDYPAPPFPEDPSSPSSILNDPDPPPDPPPD